MINIKCLRKYLWLLPCLMPWVAYAQQSARDATNFMLLEPAIADKSVSYLGQIFGTVGTVLSGTSGQLLGNVFRVFNYGMIALASILIVYTIFMTVVSTATEGEFMGRQTKSAWVVIRTAFGISLLVPAFNGYSGIQVLVMWVVLHGVGFADMAWNSLVGYVQDRGVVYSAPQPPDNIIGYTQLILNSEVCMLYSNQLARASARTNIIKTGFNVQTDNKNKQFTFPGGLVSTENPTEFKANCGVVGWDAKSDRAEQYSRPAINQMIITLMPTAQRIVDDNSLVPGQQPPTLSSSAAVTQADIAASSILRAANGYLNIIAPARVSDADHEKLETDKLFGVMKEQGWIMAGAYYYNLTSLTTKLGAQIFPNYKLVAPNSTGSVNDGSNTSSNVGSVPDGNLGFTKAELDTLGNMYAQVNTDVSNARVAAQTIQAFNNIDIGGITGSNIQSATAQKAMSHASIAANNYAGSAISWIRGLNSASSDPILSLQGMGLSMLAGAIATWAVLLIVWTTAAVFAGILTCASPAYWVLQTINAFLVPLFTIVLGILFAAGVLLGVYVPLIPLIIFTFTAIGWMIAVVEAMVAAPLVAMGMTHPQGQELLGIAGQSVILLLSVFLRPVLMIIGFAAAMLLSHVGLRLLNAGVFTLMQIGGVFGPKVLGSGPVISLVVLAVYVTLVISVVNMAFGLIYQVPDRVLRWIGAPGELPGAQAAQQALQAARGTAESAGAQMGRGVSATAEGAGKAGQTAQEGARQREKKEKENEAGAGGGQGGGAPPNLE